eukprot:TRINITY_DN2641_c1_g1_i9.p1 TRINITY_DN2641_c1_g1~~TRINITY_DN2641_c1_g1_i9.p1  ORF type:complete len:1541 (+),score=414.77 TRINITY_DN2641_c1_g1_i9:545-4624(+)
MALHEQKGGEPGGCARPGEELMVLAEDGGWLRVARRSRETEGAWAVGAVWWVRRGEAHAGLTAAWLRAAQDGLEALSKSPRAPLAAAAVAPPHMQPRQDADEGADPAAAYAARAPSILEWLFTLPAQWAAADLGDTFGNFQTWKFSTRRFIELGGSQFHPCDIVCTGGTVRGICCVTMDAQEVLARMRAAVEPKCRLGQWAPHAHWEAGGKKGPPPEIPAVPSKALALLPTHDAVDGVLAGLIYTYNLQCPNDFGTLQMLKVPRGEGPQGSSPGWKLQGLCVLSVEPGGSAAQAGVRANDVIVFLDGLPVRDDAEVSERWGRARSVGVVRARRQPRPLQLFGCINWAMREVAGATGVPGELLRRALSVFKALIWRLDRFIRTMKKGSAILYRGLAKLRMARYYCIGALILLPGFTSLSEKAGVAWDFAGEDGGTWLSLQVEAALRVAWLSIFPGEGEFLLGSNTKVLICDKPADDVRSVLSTTNDAVSLVQRVDAARLGKDKGGAVEDKLNQRLKALKAQEVIFRAFEASYVEPRVQRESDGKELKLTEAYKEFMASPAQWCVIIGALGQGKKSALLYMYSRELRMDGHSGRPGDGPGIQPSTPNQRVPLFVSVPLVEKVAEKDGWLRRQVCKQLDLKPNPSGGEWEVLQRRQMVVFADSADESSAQPEQLRARSLADRSGLPTSSKGILSVREENMRRLWLETVHLGGKGCTVLRLMPFGDQEREAFCKCLASRTAEQAVTLLKKRAAGAGKEVPIAAELRGLPGCSPPEQLMLDLQGAVALGAEADIKKREQEYSEEVQKLTQQRVAQLPARITSRTTLYSMAAEVAGELSESVPDVGSVIMEKALRRRMRRGAALVDHDTLKTVPDWRVSEEEKVDVLMRAAEAVSASLVLNKKWEDRIATAAEKAAPLFEALPDVGFSRSRSSSDGLSSSSFEALPESSPEASPAMGSGVHFKSKELLLALFPGLPLRTPCAEDPESYFTLPQRQVHAWLAVQWAVRACGRHEKDIEKANNVIENLKHWGGAFGAAADARRLMADELEKAAKENGKSDRARLAKQARIDALGQQGDKRDAAEKLGAFAKECEKAFGAEDELTISALYRQGKCLCEAQRAQEHGAPSCAQAVDVLRRVLKLSENGKGFSHTDTLAAARWLGYALVKVGKWDEGEQLLKRARDCYAGSAVSDLGSPRRSAARYGEWKCNGSLATLYRACKMFKESERLRHKQIAKLGKVIGHTHPDTLSAVWRLGDLMLEMEPGRWPEALPLFKTAFEGFQGALPQNHPYLDNSANSYACALYRADRANEAERVLRSEGLWDKREDMLAEAQKWLERKRALYAGSSELAGQIEQQLERVKKGREARP